MKAFIIALLGITFANLSSAGQVDLLKACKRECPKAKTQLEAFACTEILEHESRAAFGKTDCGKAHEAFEKELSRKSPSSDS